MQIRIILVAICLSISAISTSVFAQVGRNGLISPQVAQRMGLKRAWFTHVKMDRSRSRVIQITQHVNWNKSRTVFDVVYAGGKETFSELGVDLFGRTLGKQGAESLADQRVKQLAAMQIEATKETVIIPEITVYAVTDSAVVHAIDAETGATRWFSIVGKPRYPTTSASISDNHVAVVNGSKLYVLNPDDGKLIWSKKTFGVPDAGPAVSDDFVFLPNIQGVLESYELADYDKRPSFFHGSGRATAPPTITGKRVVWPTSRGNIYIRNANRKGKSFQVNASAPIVAPIAQTGDGRFITASLDGYVYCVEDKKGTILWRYAALDPISQAPSVAGDSVYIVTDRGKLLRIMLETGVLADSWSTPEVSGFLAAGKDHVFCRGGFGSLIAINAQTGGVVARMEADVLDMTFVNSQTDRILIGSKTGLLQCLHESALERALIYNSPMPSEINGPDDSEDKSGKPADEAPAPMPQNDPFGGGNANPFGGGNEKPKDASDNPFGGEGKKTEEKSDNPFG